MSCKSLYDKQISEGLDSLADLEVDSEDELICDKIQKKTISCLMKMTLPLLVMKKTQTNMMMRIT